MHWRDERALRSKLRESSRELVRTATNGSLTATELERVEILARALDLRAQSRRSWAPLLIITLIVAGLFLLQIRRDTVAVRVRVEAGAGSIEPTQKEEVPFRLRGSRLTIHQAVAEPGPAELGELIGPHKEGGVILQADSQGSIWLQRATLPPGSKLTVRSGETSVQIELRCRGACEGSRIELAGYGNVVHAGKRLRFRVPRGIYLRPEAGLLRIELTRRDSTPETMYAGTQLIREASFERPMITVSDDSPTLSGVSAVQDGRIAFPDYPAHNRSLEAGSDVGIRGERLRLHVLEVRPHKLTFTLVGEATTLLVDGQDLRPTWLDYLRTRPELLFLASLAAVIGGYVTLWNLLRGRS